MEVNVYEALGEEKVRELVRCFYENVKNQPALRKLYPEDLTPAEERLFWFLSHVFGGPHTYLEQRGHPMLRRRHFQWPIDGNMRNLWLDCMLQSIDQIDMSSEVREALIGYFVKVANHMVNQ
jgi:hemoglobin